MTEFSRGTNFRIPSCIWLFSLVLAVSTGAFAEEHAVYAGGTVASIEKGQQGNLDLDSQSFLLFSYGKHETYRLPYARITGMEFAIAPGPKNQKYQLTISFADDHGSSVMVFELARKAVETTVPVLEERTGKKVAAKASGPLPEVRITELRQTPVVESEHAEPGRPALLVESDPTGANVFLNGAPMGKTPFSFTLPWSVGLPYNVKVTKPGYYEALQQLTVVPGTNKVKVDLIPVHGRNQ